MTTLLHPSAARSLGPTAEQRLLLTDLSWDRYITIGELLADRPTLRLTYNRGTLEFMTISARHERFKHWLGRFVETIAEELEKPIAPGGSMTFQDEEQERGFELDNCYWIENEAAVREKLTWEPTIDPPPDLALEIEISRSALNRLGIFAAFRIPEVWCYDGKDLRIYLLQPDGTYLQSDTSRAFPTIPVKELVRFFPTVERTDYLSAVRAVRVWVREFIEKKA